MFDYEVSFQIKMIFGMNYLFSFEDGFNRKTDLSSKQVSGSLYELAISKFITTNSSFLTFLCCWRS